MNFIKFFLILFMSVSMYSCCSTKSIVSKEVKEEKTIVETTSESTTEEDFEVIQVDDATEEDEDVEETILSDAEIEDDVQTDYVTMKSTVDHSIWDNLLQKHVSEEGQVNYKGFKASKIEFYSYLEMLSKNAPEESWSKDDTLAYWMNVYNAFTVKLILDNYPTKSIKDISGPWNHRFIKIGEKWYTLNDVEHRIIRKMDEPRIHFALVCAAISCPRLYNKAFTAKTLEADLELLTKGFLSDTSKNEFSENAIKISKIFKWYGGDFKTNGKNLIDFLNQYTEVEILPKAKKSYKDYNWNLNE